MEKLRTLVWVILAFATTMLAARVVRVHAACSFPFAPSSCSFSMSATCTIDASSTETYECTTSESSSVSDYSITLGNNDLSFGSSGTLNVSKIIISGTGGVANATGRVINLGGSTSAGPLWVVDGDADGWSANFTTTYTATASGRRRRSLMRGTTTDCNDAAYLESNTCYSYGQGYYYGYGQGYYYGYGEGSYVYGTPYHIFWPGFTPN